VSVVVVDSRATSKIVVMRLSPTSPAPIQKLICTPGKKCCKKKLVLCAVFHECLAHMKKLLSIVVLLGFVSAVLLAGCSKSDDTSSPASTNAPASTNK
jgi:hypothetical protein